MQKTYVKIGVLGVAILLFCGCSGYNRILKSGKPDAMFSKALEYYNAGKYSKAMPLLEEVMRYTTGTNRADSVIFYLASSYYKTKDYETSGMMFDEFRKTYMNSVFLEDAEYMYAKGYYLLSPAPNRDQSSTYRALVAIDEYVERYPESPHSGDMLNNTKELKQKLEDKSYINAKSYYKTEKYKSAIVALENILTKYPDTEYREEVLYLTAKSNYLLAHRSMEHLQRDRYLNMMDAYYNFVGEFPESKYMGELNRMLEEAKAYSARFHVPDDTEENDNTTSNGN